MSKELDELEAELSQWRAEMKILRDREIDIKGRISELRLIEWLAYKGIHTRTFPLNIEMQAYIFQHGFPGGYIEYVKDAWAIGMIVTIKGITESEQHIKVAPSGYHPGLFPPDMVVRAVKESNE